MATMPVVSDKGDVRWSLFRDAACSEAARMLVGSFAAERLLSACPGSKQGVSESPSSELSFGGVQLVPEIERHARRLLAQQRAPAQPNAASGCIYSDVFPVVAEDLTLGHTDAPETLYCKLELELHEPADADMESASAASECNTVETGWFAWKLSRARDYRARGSESFKVGRVRAAVALYKRALAWLEAPTSSSTGDVSVAFSPAELELVAPVAVACHANLAACYSKLEGDGHVERSIASASRALELEPDHVKARFRRSQAYMVAKEYDAALEDLARLRELEPKSALFRSALARAQAAKAHFLKQQQSKFATLFK